MLAADEVDLHSIDYILWWIRQILIYFFTFVNIAKKAILNMLPARYKTHQQNV